MKNTTGRTHIVLIPGFAGFDALGQMQYYSGITEQFKLWSKERENESVELHYFDNFPTAAVETRAKRLLAYLAERVARGTFAVGKDRIALVGHSTGGLDIRKLICVLSDSHENKEPIYADGVAVRAADILSLISEIVFISVPQFGTNLANRISGNFFLREAIITELRTVVAASQVPVVDKIQGFLSNCTSAALNLDIALAVQDALNECEGGTPRNRMTTALAQEAASELSLWLRHMAWDFSVVNDLAISDFKSDSTSPAHFTQEMRNAEVENWHNFGITARSLVTLAGNPSKKSSNWGLNLIQENGAATDITYQWCYQACAKQVPQQLPSEQPAPKVLWSARPTNEFVVTLDATDNDGIVNTTSMLWPSTESLLVECDHMDIVGHYKRVLAQPESKAKVVDTRKYTAYDLLKSGSAFDDAAFKLVWGTIFDFCGSTEPASKMAGAVS
jgi:triacylglycerol lipase